jgi:hypothetical protein
MIVGIFLSLALIKVINDKRNLEFENMKLNSQIYDIKYFCHTALPIEKLRDIQDNKKWFCKNK